MHQCPRKLLRGDWLLQASRATRLALAGSHPTKLVVLRARIGTISLPESDTQLFSSYQEQGWTNSGTSGSPATAILQAAAATTYTDPDGNVIFADGWVWQLAGKMPFESVAKFFAIAGAADHDREQLLGPFTLRLGP